ncbi:hypothetical protein ACHAPT_005366 [Fusarium lateritium]
MTRYTLPSAPGVKSPALREDPPKAVMLLRDVAAISRGDCTEIVRQEADGFSCCTIGKRMSEMSLALIDSGSFFRLPLSDYCPEATQDMKRADATRPEQCIKRPRIEDWIEPDQDFKWAARSMRQIKAYELLEACEASIPNIGRYYGCITEEGRVTGLCIEKGTSSLDEKLQGMTKDQRHDCYEAIQSAVVDLQVLGLFHNDVTPANIRMRGNVPFITNFDNCKHIDVLRSEEGARFREAKHWERHAESICHLRDYIFKDCDYTEMIFHSD